jgi:ketosteroid isomerase-like protein
VANAACNRHLICPEVAMKPTSNAAPKDSRGPSSLVAATHLRHVAPRRLLCALGVLLALTACGAPVVSPGVPVELKHSWEVSFNQGDSAAVAALYSEEAQLVMSGSAPIQGKAAIRKTVDDMIKSGVKLRIGATQNVGSGDIAYVYGPYSVFEHDGGREVESGTYIEVWRRRAGAWQIDLDVNAVGAAVAARPQPPP